ncbi:hypothetical protein AB0395_22220 [Streptosporangium sp. NPDC051023]|uniref:hypothetical protein n=1 Tax=Streptosporangium sp. NPDC051023 TaxID=3155410 RepID=UPI0034501E4C
MEITSASDGYLSGAVCPACGAGAVYLVEAVALRRVALAGMMPKLGGEFGVRALCRGQECVVPPSPVVTPSRPRSYE